MTQPTLWSAGAREPEVADLDGLLAGPGHIAVRGAAARIGVVVAPSRADRLVALLRLELGLEAEITVVAGESGLAVRTPWLVELRPVADAWRAGAMTRPPAGWMLDGPRLRWWCIAAGSRASRDLSGSQSAGAPGGPDKSREGAASASYTLMLARSNEIAWPAIGAAMSAVGIAGAFIGPRADGPAYRVVGQRRLKRLRELVGDPPPGVPATDWPPPSSHRLPVAP